MNKQTKYYMTNSDSVTEWIKIGAMTERGAKMIASKTFGKSAQIGQDFGCGVEETHWRGIDGEWNER